MKPNLIRRIAAVTVVAASAVGVASVPAGATTFSSDGSHADASATCVIPGLVGYRGAGFTYVRFSSWVDGSGWMLGNWQYFRRNWNEDMVLSLAPVPQRGRTFAVYAEYISVNPLTNATSTAGEWLKIDNNGYWCTVR